MPRLLSLLLPFALFLGACVSQRAPVPPGTIPSQKNLPSADEAYGHEVYSSLVDQFQVERDDLKISRVEKIIDRLTQLGAANKNPWHVVVFNDPTFKNAAATRGNYVFVWSGMLDTVQNDDELAAVLAHEIGHVLAGHTDPDPAEEINEMLSGTAGRIAGEITYRQGAAGIAANLAEVLVSESLKALVVNPESQRKELEADHIGLFLMADAGYDPEKAVEFWKRASLDPELSGSSLQFLSSHPSSDLRSENLARYLEEAKQRHSKALGRNAPDENLRADLQQQAGSAEKWIVAEEWATVYKTPHTDSEVLIDLPKHTRIQASPFNRRWLYMEAPLRGYVRGRDLSPES